MLSKKMQYIIKSVPTSDAQALENLLNEMSAQGWDLYTMHEMENENSIDFNCIFVREKYQDEDKTDLDDILDVIGDEFDSEKLITAVDKLSCKYSKEDIEENIHRSLKIQADPQLAWEDYKIVLE